jgi:uncharacterized peroxidase-related enzyme
MSHPRVPTPEGLPGIVGLMAFRPETGRALQQLANSLLVGPFPGSTLTRGERELIAAVVSTRNECAFCAASHAAVAAAQLPEGKDLVDSARRDSRAAPLSSKLKALLTVAEQVARSGREVTDEAIARARAEGANDIDVHDTVLIASAFCMFNRYVDGLAAQEPSDPRAYEGMAHHIVAEGYAR